MSEDMTMAKMTKNTISTHMERTEQMTRLQSHGQSRLTPDGKTMDKKSIRKDDSMSKSIHKISNSDCSNSNIWAHVTKTFKTSCTIACALAGSLLALSLLLSLFAVNTAALELGLTPGDIVIDHVLSGGYAEVPFTLSTDSVDNITINLYHLNDSTINDWITYDPAPSYITISQAKPYIGKVIVQVPATATSGNYSVLNKFTVLRPLTTTDSDTTADIALSMGQKVEITVVSDKISGCTIYSDSLQAEGIVGQDIVESIFLRNDGNINLDDSLNYTIYDVNETKIITEGSIPLHVLPTKIETVPLSLPTDNLAAGQYAVSLSLGQCSLSRRGLQFTLFAQGAKFVKGDLTSVVIPIRVYNVTNTTITGEFENTGDVTVTAHMISQVLLDGRIVNIVESQPAVVSAGSSTSFVTSMDSKARGKYQVDSYVVYDSYQTPKTTAYVNFIDDSAGNGATGSSSISPATIVKIVIVLVIVLLIILIVVKKKRSKQQPQHQHQL